MYVTADLDQVLPYNHYTHNWGIQEGRRHSVLPYTANLQYRISNILFKIMILDCVYDMSLLKSPCSEISFSGEQYIQTMDWESSSNEGPKRAGFSFHVLFTWRSKQNHFQQQRGFKKFKPWFKPLLKHSGFNKLGQWTKYKTIVLSNYYTTVSFKLMRYFPL